jgi:hypothetical protein
MLVAMNVVSVLRMTQITISSVHCAHIASVTHYGLVVRVPGYRYRDPRFDSRRYQIF